MFDTRFRLLSQPMTTDGMNVACKLLGVEKEELWSVLDVETQGCGFFRDGRTVILYERHIFSRFTKGVYDRGFPNISNPQPGGYGKGGAWQYQRLSDAMALDYRNALLSTSWGIGQVMGFNFGVAGYKDVEPMVEAFANSEDAQLFSMALFIKSKGIDVHLRDHSWALFARVYNGPSFAKNAYDTKLQKAYDRRKVEGIPDLEDRAKRMKAAFEDTFLGREKGS